MSNELTDVRCPCGAEFQADSYDAGFIAGSGMCQNCDAALPPKDICTCPSGDGSLRHPCPAHPTVEQAGGDERAAFEYWASDEGLYPKAVERAGNCYKLAQTQSYWMAWQARAALAQPSPKCEFCGGTGEISGVEGEYDWVNGPCPRCAYPAQAEQAEAERPEVVAYRTIGRHTKHQHPHYALNYYKQNAEDQAAHWRERGCEVSEDELMTVAQHERIVGELRTEIAMLRSYESEWELLLNQHEQERDAALARVAELESKMADLEKQEPLKLSADVHEFLQEVINSVMGGEDVDMDYEFAGQLGKLLDPVYTAPVAQAQHSVPGNAAALVRAEGKKYSLNAAGMLDSGCPEHAQTFAIVQLLSEFDDEEAESHWKAIMAYSDFRTSDALFHAAELLAAAPGKEGL